MTTDPAATLNAAAARLRTGEVAMSPPVALALAMVFDTAADVGCECGLVGDDPLCEHEALLAVARLVLGEAS